MKLEVEVISKEIVKPTSPTPERLRRYQLSFLDQLTPPIYNPWVFFYPEICDTEANKITTSDQLKQSISKALTYFYPLAGRIREDQLFVDCNDEGIPFVEARVKSQLSDFINDPVPNELNKLLPFELHFNNAKEVPLGIQFNVFGCGGIGIGVCISHKIGDALSFFSFVNLWAAIARGETKLFAPEFVSASLFPPRDLSGYSPSDMQTEKEQTITKRFVFAATKIEEIRRKYASFENQTRPTRVEALSAFIWSRFITATDTRSRPDTFCMIIQLVNLRTRIDPPLPEYSFGNLFSFTLTTPSIEDSAGESNICHNFIAQLRDAIKRLNKEIVKEIQDGYNRWDDIKDLATSSAAKGETMVPLAFTSLSRFPTYEADFGWGRPIWGSSAHRDAKNVVTFVDTAAGNGMEAWVTLTEDDMAKFDSDEELLACISAPKSGKDDDPCYR